MQPLLEITSENENISKHSPSTNNIFGIIFYNLKDSNNTTNVVTNVAISNAIYILLNTVRTKSTTVKKTNVITIEKNIVTTNQKTKVKRKNTKDFAKYISSNPTTTTTINK